MAGLSHHERHSIVRALILHDWFKKHESLALRRAINDGSFSLELLDELKAKDANILLEMGIPSDIVNLTGANIPNRAEGPTVLAEKIILYVDIMLTNTEPVPIDERFDNLERGWDGTKVDPERARRYKFFSAAYQNKYGGKSMFEVQRALGRKLSLEFSEMFGYAGDPNKLPLFLKKKFQEKLGCP
ncbi:MAG: hypothetical protein HYT12_01990 [Candidatus Liptonbacteria bacterium]|nr:hypothetical protein [Candidatus Liptonbacteria bacterium]